MTEELLQIEGLKIASFSQPTGLIRTDHHFRKRMTADVPANTPDDVRPATLARTGRSMVGGKYQRL
jgi:hypothetical protein